MQERTVRFPNDRGQKLAGLLTLPKAQRPPVVIVSPSLRGDKNYQPILQPFASTFAKNGFAVLRYDTAGFGDSEGKSEDMTVKSQIADLKAAISFVRSLPVDASRVGLVGFSIGAICSIRNASQKGVRALVLWSPAFQLKTLYERYAHHAQEIQEKGFFDSKAALTGRPYRIGGRFLEECKNLDLAKDLEKVRVPVLALFGARDLPHRMAAAKKGLKKISRAPTRLILVRKGSHDFVESSAQREVIRATKDWFEKFLK